MEMRAVVCTHLCHTHTILFVLKEIAAVVWTHFRVATYLCVHGDERRSLHTLWRDIQFPLCLQRWDTQSSWVNMDRGRSLDTLGGDKSLWVYGGECLSLHPPLWDNQIPERYRDGRCSLNPHPLDGNPLVHGGECQYVGTFRSAVLASTSVCQYAALFVFQASSSGRSDVLYLPRHLVKASLRAAV